MDKMVLKEYISMVKNFNWWEINYVLGIEFSWIIKIILVSIKNEI